MQKETNPFLYNYMLLPELVFDSDPIQNTHPMP
jgi:hypothetical protein